LHRQGTRREIRSMSFMVKSTPASRAAARRCSTVLVDPPMATSRLIAFSKAAKEAMLRGSTVASSRSYQLRASATTSRPASRNRRLRSAWVATIEPFPGRCLSGLKGIHLISKRVQELELSFFDRLEAGDLLFIDSSHAVKTGSDVLFLYLEVIPRLRAGVVIHIHDIGLPYVYPRDVLSHFHAWQETALLVALLQGNQHLRVLCCLSALHYDRRAEMARILPDYRPQIETGEGLAEADPQGHFPSSIWLATA